MAQRARVCLVLVVLSLIVIAGCTSSTHPTDTPALTLDGRFGFVWNKGVYLSKTNLTGSSSEVDLEPNFGVGVDTNTKLLWISLYYSFIDLAGGFQQIDAEIAIPILNPVAQNVMGTHVIGAWDDPVLASGGVLIYPVQYGSVAGGKVTITKFDTVNNLISGTFNFSTEIEHPTSGYDNAGDISSGFFNDISISTGGFNIGAIAMDVDGSPFTTQFEDRQRFSAYKLAASPTLTVIAFDDNVSPHHELQFSIPSPHAGSFSFTSSTTGTLHANQAVASYSDGTSSIEASATNGQLVITKYDEANRRLSGTFSFTGTDPNSGKSIAITNGVLDNVQWAVN